MYKPEIGEVLTRHLGVVAAPEELWNRIENPQISAVPARFSRVRGTLALAALGLVGVVAFNTRRATVEVQYSLPQHTLTLQVSKAAQPAEALNAACLRCHAGG